MTEQNRHSGNDRPASIDLLQKISASSPPAIYSAKILAELSRNAGMKPA
jgi:hypothetical protein